MSDGKITAALILIVAIWLCLMIIGLSTQRNELDQYGDTITEYMTCIKYNSDCDCSDIILSEYGEEVQ